MDKFHQIFCKMWTKKMFKRRKSNTGTLFYTVSVTYNSGTVINYCSGSAKVRSRPSSCSRSTRAKFYGSGLYSGFTTLLAGNFLPLLGFHLAVCYAARPYRDL
jgi:hypothetical protein